MPSPTGYRVHLLLPGDTQHYLAATQSGWRASTEVGDVWPTLEEARRAMAQAQSRLDQMEGFPRECGTCRHNTVVNHSYPRCENCGDSGNGWEHQQTGPWFRVEPFATPTGYRVQVTLPNDPSTHYLSATNPGWMASTWGGDVWPTVEEARMAIQEAQNRFDQMTVVPVYTTRWYRIQERVGVVWQYLTTMPSGSWGTVAARSRATVWPSLLEVSRVYNSLASDGNHRDLLIEPIPENEDPNYLVQGLNSDLWSQISAQAQADLDESVLQDALRVSPTQVAINEAMRTDPERGRQTLREMMTSTRRGSEMPSSFAINYGMEDALRTLNTAFRTDPESVREAIRQMLSHLEVIRETASEVAKHVPPTVWERLTREEP